MSAKLNNGKIRLLTPIDWKTQNMANSKGRFVYSDDNGKTWQLAQSYFGGNAYYPNESQVFPCFFCAFCRFFFCRKDELRKCAKKKKLKNIHLKILTYCDINE